MRVERVDAADTRRWLAVELADLGTTLARLRHPLDSHGSVICLA